MELRASQEVDKCSATGQHPQPLGDHITFGIVLWIGFV